MIDLVWYLRVSRPIRIRGMLNKIPETAHGDCPKANDSPRCHTLVRARGAGKGRDPVPALRASQSVHFSDSASHRVLGHIEQRCGPLVFARVYGKLDRKVQSLATGGRGGIATVNRWADLRVNLEWRDRVGPLADTNARRNECQSTGSVLAVSK
jgi:hypothetical protein